MSEGAPNTNAPNGAGGVERQGAAEQAAGAGAMRGGARAARTAADEAGETMTRAADAAAGNLEAGGRVATRMASAAQASTTAGTTIAQGAQDMTREWATQAQQVFQRNVDTLNALMQARTLGEAMTIQDRYLRESIDGMLQASRRLSEMMVATTGAAMRSAGASMGRDDGPDKN